MDFFEFFRYLLGTIVTIYATVTTAQWAMSWYKWLSQADRHISLIRRYVVVSGLRLRWITFSGDVTIMLLLCVVFALLWHAHGTVAQIADALTNVHRRPQALH